MADIHSHPWAVILFLPIRDSIKKSPRNLLKEWSTNWQVDMIDCLPSNRNWINNDRTMINWIWTGRIKTLAQLWQGICEYPPVISCEQCFSFLTYPLRLWSVSVLCTEIISLATRLNECWSKPSSSSSLREAGTVTPSPPAPGPFSLASGGNFS